MPVYEEKEKINGQKRYYIRTYVTDENGKKKQITKHNKGWIGRDGYWLAYQEENQLRNKKIIKEKNIGFDELCKKFIKYSNTINKESTCYDYQSVINSRLISFFANKDVAKISINDIKKWKECIDKKKLNITYKNKCYTVLNLILNYGVKNNIIEENPLNKIDCFKKTQDDKQKIQENEPIRYITYEQFKKLISVIDDDFWCTFFNLLYFTGIRIGELQALKWNDINFENNTISINKTLTTKTTGAKWKLTSTKNLKNRMIDIDSNLSEKLIQFLEQQKKKENFNYNWFVMGNDQPLKENKINHNKEKYFKKANIKEITNHEFRHSHVSLLINEYLKNDETDTAKFFIMASKRMGHTIEVMTKTYLHLFPDIQKPIVKLLETLDNK